MEPHKRGINYKQIRQRLMKYDINSVTEGIRFMSRVLNDLKNKNWKGLTVRLNVCEDIKNFFYGIDAKDTDKLEMLYHDIMSNKNALGFGTDRRATEGRSSQGGGNSRNAPLDLEWQNRPRGYGQSQRSGQGNQKNTERKPLKFDQIYIPETNEAESLDYLRMVEREGEVLEMCMEELLNGKIDRNNKYLYDRFLRQIEVFDRHLGLINSKSFTDQKDIERYNLLRDRVPLHHQFAQEIKKNITEAYHTYKRLIRESRARRCMTIINETLHRIKLIF